MWSPCSAEKLSSSSLECLDDRHPEDTDYKVVDHPPGLDLDAAAQCAVLLRDRSSFVDLEKKELICESIKYNNNSTDIGTVLT